MMKKLKDFNVIHLNLLSLHLVALYIGSGKYSNFKTVQTISMN